MSANSDKCRFVAATVSERGDQLLTPGSGAGQREANQVIIAGCKPAKTCLACNQVSFIVSLMLDISGPVSVILIVHTTREKRFKKVDFIYYVCAVN